MGRLLDRQIAVGSPAKYPGHVIGVTAHQLDNVRTVAEETALLSHLSPFADGWQSGLEGERGKRRRISKELRGRDDRQRLCACRPHRGKSCRINRKNLRVKRQQLEAECLCSPAYRREVLLALLWT